MPDLLVVSTGTSINALAGSKLVNLATTTDILSWSFSYDFCVKQGVYPKFYSYVDPHSAMQTLKVINKNTTLLIFDKIVNDNYAALKKYIGTSQMVSNKTRGNLQEGKYQPYLDLLKTAVQKCPVKYIPSGSVKHNPLGLTREDGRGVLLGDKQSLKVGKNQEKLTCCIFPLILYLKKEYNYNRILLSGFDGAAGRYFATSNSRGVPDMKKSYSLHMPGWIALLKKHDIEVVSLMKKSVINKYMKVITL